MRRLRSLGWLLVLAALVLPACSPTSPSTLETKGPAAARIAGTWWFMFWVSLVVVLFVGALLLLGMFRRRRSERGADDPHGVTSPRHWERRLLLFGGVVGPLIVLAVLWVVTLRDVNFLAAPLRSNMLTVDVIGRLWWWEVRYPEQGIVTANEIHIPVGQPVRIRLTSNGVIHSFWVPELAGKTDMIAGQTNNMWLEASQPGVYRGQCAEYCGRQHTHMIFFVIAEPQATFERWVQREASSVPAPAAANLTRGQRVFETNACAGCHTIRGTTAAGRVGPDLTHFGSRRTIGAGTVPNTRSLLAAWVVNAQSIKPGNLMPPVPLPPDDVQALVDYLESLK
ncbi:MAG TPA: cytochrome c oxidase subunit II [Actinomycetota bacterium]|nr:cytochrome c oxidase subunit II [Actinomycetota bacterium]